MKPIITPTAIMIFSFSKQKLVEELGIGSYILPPIIAPILTIK